MDPYPTDTNLFVGVSVRWILSQVLAVKDIGPDMWYVVVVWIFSTS